MKKNRKMTAVLFVLGILLLVFQALLVGIAAPKAYWLIHEWLFYAINYAIIFCLFFAAAWSIGNRYVKGLLLLAGFALLTANTTFFYHLGDVNLVISESENGQHEVILKEYKKMNKETVRLERRGILFGKKGAVLAGSSAYKVLEEEQYKIEWPAEDLAVLTYRTGNGNALDQQIFNFRSSDYVRYQNVAVSLIGKWVEQENPENYFLSDNSEFIYAKDGELYYYDIENTEQFGIYSLVIKGDEEKPTLTVVLNPGTEFGEDGLIMDGGSVTITPVSLGETENEVYEKEQINQQ